MFDIIQRVETNLKPETEKKTPLSQIASASGVVMVGFVISNLVGLLRQMLITNAFGTSAVLDAFYAAERLPNILFTLVAGGALASAFIPSLTSLISTNKHKDAWHLASSIINLVTLVLMFVSVLAFIFSDQIVIKFLAPDFIPELQTLTAALLRIMLLTTIIFGISGLLMGILNVHQSFLLPALAPTMYWLGMIGGVLFLVPKMGVYGLAWGAVVGAGMHLGVQAPGILRLPGRAYQFSLGLKTAAVRQVGRLMAPRLLGVAVVQLNFLVNVIVATGLPPGSLTAIVVAFQIMTMPQVVIAQAISIAALPTFSAQVAQGELGEMRQSLAATIRGILLLSLPAAVGLILLREPIISLLFERGQFDARSVELTAWALLWYTVGLVGHSLVEILSRAFYALHDTKTPVLIGTLAMSLNVILSFTLPNLFHQIGWLPLGGLALANTLATALEMVILLYLMYKRLDGIAGAYIFTGALKSIVSASIMGGGIVFWLQSGNSYQSWVIAVGGIIGGGLIYFLAMTGLKLEEIGSLTRLLKARLKK
ncbi:MAG: murein biosynthesis integral membrane protein MurJ [Chloroflexota bacterium]